MVKNIVKDKGHAAVARNVESCMGEKKNDNCADEWEMEKDDPLPLVSKDTMCDAIDMYYRLTISDY